MAKPKIASEQESRKSLLHMARRFNCEGEVKDILAKYDKALARCTNEAERHAIGTAGLAELHKFFYCRGALIVNGQVVIPAESGYEGSGKFTKLS